MAEYLDHPTFPLFINLDIYNFMMISSQNQNKHEFVRKNGRGMTNQKPFLIFNFHVLLRANNYEQCSNSKASDPYN